MKRRVALFSCFKMIFGLYAINPLELKAQSLERNNDIEETSESPIRFSNEAFVDRIGSDTWSIRMKLNVRGKHRGRDIPVRIEFATDPSFSQIIHHKTIIAQRQNMFFVWYIHKTKYPSIKLFVRGVCNKTATPSTKALTQETFDIHSPIKEMTPWNN